MLHTLGLLVPFLNFFVVYWLWRDLDELRRRAGLPGFPIVGYVVGSIFLAPVFYSLVNERLNQYWDTRSQGYATDAPVTSTEKIVTAIGAGLFALWILFCVLLLILAVATSSSSG